MPTNAAFLTAVQALEVTGVRLILNEPPEALNSADLPASFPLMPQGGLGEKVVSCFAKNKARAIRFVIAMEAVGEGTVAQNYATLAAQMDYLETALDGLEISQSGTLAPFIEYDIEAAIINVGGNDFWGVVADLRVRDI